MVKRPLGLNKAAKSKKAKTEETPTPAPEDATEQQAQIELDADEDDELGQVLALYKQAQEQGNEAGKQKLLSGVVNECDSLLRQAAEKKEDDKLPGDFHNVYALALYDLSMFADPFEEEKENSEQFLEAALDRVETGFTVPPDNPSLCITKVKVLLELVTVAMKKSLVEEQVYETAEKNLKRINEAIKLYETATEGSNAMDQVKAVNQFLELANWLVALEKEHAEGKLTAGEGYINWCKTRLEKLVETDDDDAVKRLASKGLGEYYLEEADKHDPEDTAQAAEHEKLARRALDYLLKAESNDEKEALVLPVIAEAQIELANFLYEQDGDDTSEADQLYKDGVMRLKKAQRLGLGDFAELLEELQQDDE